LNKKVFLYFPYSRARAIFTKRSLIPVLLNKRNKDAELNCYTRDPLLNGRQIRGRVSFFLWWSDFCVSFYTRKVGGRQWRE